MQSPDALLLHVAQSSPSTTGVSVPPFVSIDARAATMPRTNREPILIRANCMFNYFLIMKPAFVRSSQNEGYDLLTTCGLLMLMGILNAIGAKASAMR